MPRSTIINDTEIGEIFALRAQGLTQREMASRVKQSQHVVSHILGLGVNFGKKERPSGEV